jgi:hypothetical protein
MKGTSSRPLNDWSVCLAKRRSQRPRTTSASHYGVITMSKEHDPTRFLW